MTILLGVPVATPGECSCCQENVRMITKMGEAGMPGLMCIINHPGFQTVSAHLPMPINE